MANKKANFLEFDSSILEKNLTFVHNDFAENLEKCFKAANTNSATAPPRDFKIITPSPGFCIKSFTTNTQEKYFINVCQTNELPPPEDITEGELSNILKSTEPSNFRIPMSISEPRKTKDKSGRPVDVCDVAINPKFFDKVQKFTLFKEFFMALISEALSAKYDVQLLQEKSFILNNRKFIGNLVPHRVRNNDVKTVLTSYKNPSEEDLKKIDEINAVEKGQSKKKSPLIQELATPTYIVPIHNLVGILNEQNDTEEFLAEFYLPQCVSINDISVYIGEDRILVQSDEHGYLFDKFFDLKLEPRRADAHFEQSNKTLHIRIPVSL